MGSVTLSAAEWTSIGPAPINTKGGLDEISGRIQAAAPDPTNSTVIYVGADNGGIWKTTVSPPNWTPLTDSMPSLYMTGYHTLVVHPANNNLVLGLVSGVGGGLLKSSDAGNTWQLLANSQFDGKSLTSLAVDPTDQQTMYLSAAKSGAWQSADGGQTWQKMTGLPSGSVWDLVLANYDSNTMFAAVVGNTGAQQSQNGVYKSTDGGATWTLLGGGLPPGAALGASNADGTTTPGAVRIESGATPGVVYVSMLTVGANPTPPPTNAVTAIQRFTSGESGASWTALQPTSSNPEFRSWHLLLAVDPGNAKHVFANDAYSLYESHDGGQTWSEADANIGYLQRINHFDFVNLTFDTSGKALVTADQGLLRYDPAAKSWTSLVGNLEVSEFYTIGLDPGTASTAYAVGQDIFSEKFTGQTTWNVMEGGINETGRIIVDPNNTSQLFASNPLDVDNFVMKSTDAGATWTNVFPNSQLNIQSQNYTFAYLSQKAFAMDPSNSARLLVVEDRVFETTDSGSTWAPISGVLSQDPTNPFVAALAIAPSDGNTVYAATQDGRLWRTQNNGGQWSEYDTGLFGVVADLRIDPANAGHAFAVTNSAVWHLPASGLPWVNITGTIPGGLGLHSVFVDWQPATPTLFVGTDRGLYLSVDIGATWIKWGPGLPNALINDLQGETLPGGSLLLAAASYGRGAWEILLKSCSIILNRNPIAQDEVDARRLQPAGSQGGLPIQDAFRVVVDGFTASQLGLTGPGSTLPSLPSLSPGTGITITPSTPVANSSDTGDYGPEFQRFTFYYDINFANHADPAFQFAGESHDLTLTADVAGVSSSAVLTLIKEPDPFLLHGTPSWLSIDLRVFVVRQGVAMFGVPGIADASDAPRFIQQLRAAITPAQFDSLSTLEEQSKLYIQPTDENDVPIFNFALAKVHYIGLAGAPNVRVFFRLFQAQSTTSTFDYPPGRQYRREPSNPDGQPIPLAGIIFNEYVTIPCFANGRVDTTTAGMDQQTDEYNIQSITANADGSEVDTFYGCWLDINQPFKADGFTPNNVLPAVLDAASPDGPFTDWINPPLPIQSSILRNLHQCLIAEIAFDQTPIPIGKNTSDWDKLAQRNIAWSDAGSAQGVTTFETRPTQTGSAPGQAPDELMIDWQSLPKGSSAQIYLPAVKAADILAMAKRQYSAHGLRQVDDHTLRCRTGGVTYVPIPPGGAVNYAGLLTVDVPNTVTPGQTFDVVVRQVTNVSGRRPAPPPPPPQIQGRRSAVISASRPLRPGEVFDVLAFETEPPAPAAAAPPPTIEWGQVTGAFQLTIPVKAKNTLLLPEERDLSALRWIGQSIPSQSRWYPVFQRYLQTIANRVTAFGGDPAQISPSPTGDGTSKPPRPRRHIEYTGKVAGLIFDHFGDFEGFLLETGHGEHEFFSREREIRELVERAWRERLRITVWVERDERRTPASIIVREPPVPF